MAQQLIVGLIVAAAAFYAVWRWMPAGWRRGAAQKLARRPAGVPRQPAQRLGVLGAGMMGAGIAQVAAAAGSPRAFRAAGNALGSNPLAIVIPCHRVVASGGGLGGYGGGPDRKRLLLELEGAGP